MSDNAGFDAAYLDEVVPCPACGRCHPAHCEMTEARRSRPEARNEGQSTIHRADGANNWT